MEWRGGTTKKIGINANEYEGQVLIKEERMPDGRVKRILKNKTNGVITETVD